MKKVAIAIAIVALLGLVLSCSSYKAKLIEQAETGNVTPVTLEQATKIQSHEAVVTFVITNRGISVDSVVYIGDFYKGAEADATYLIRNESDFDITPVIYYARGTRVDDYSAAEGKGYEDAPSFVEGWVKVIPEPSVIPSKTAQGYVVSITMPDEDIEGLPQKFAFQVGVGVGNKVQLAACPWWLITMKMEK